MIEPGIMKICCNPIHKDEILEAFPKFDECTTLTIEHSSFLDFNRILTSSGVQLVFDESVPEDVILFHMSDGNIKRIAKTGKLK